jgi:hypothetical protein
MQVTVSFALSHSSLSCFEQLKTFKPDVMDDEDQRPDLRPVVSEWLMLWKNQANKCASKTEFVYKNALRSLKDHSEPVYSAKDFIRIKYFGEWTLPCSTSDRIIHSIRF